MNTNKVSSIKMKKKPTREALKSHMGHMNIRLKDIMTRIDLFLDQEVAVGPRKLSVIEHMCELVFKNGEWAISKDTLLTDDEIMHLNTYRAMLNGVMLVGDPIFDPFNYIMRDYQAWVDNWEAHHEPV